MSTEGACRDGMAADDQQGLPPALGLRQGARPLGPDHRIAGSGPAMSSTSGRAGHHCSGRCGPSGCPRRRPATDRCQARGTTGRGSRTSPTPALPTSRCSQDEPLAAALGQRSRAATGSAKNPHVRQDVDREQQKRCWTATSVGGSPPADAERRSGGSASVRRRWTRICGFGDCSWSRCARDSRASARAAARLRASCAITGTAVESVLDAAHISPYKGDAHQRRPQRADPAGGHPHALRPTPPDGNAPVHRSASHPSCGARSTPALDGRDLQRCQQARDRPSLAPPPEHNNKCAWLQA